MLTEKPDLKLSFVSKLAELANIFICF